MSEHARVGEQGPVGDQEQPLTRPAPEPSGVDLARVALRAARKAARERGEAAQQKGRGAARVRSGARSDERDPMRLGSAINRLITEHGWEAPAAVGGVMGRWPQIVGGAIALHCAPESFDEESRELVVRCDSPVWATELRLKAAQLLARLNADLGHGLVRHIKVLGPKGPTRDYGPLRAPGSRKPGDFYE